MQENSALGRSMAMVRDLRNRCAWDRVQTRDELDHALGSGDPAAIKSEVADLLLHLAWQLVLAEERSEFTADEAAGDLEAKMKRRHPHLFDLGPREQWETMKARERRRGGSGALPAGILEGLPPTLPDLLMAYRLQERAAGVGFDWPDHEGPAAKVREELEEVEAELGAASRSNARLDHEIGDLLFSAVNLARKAGVHPGPALARANDRFRIRFGAVERLAAERGIDLSNAGLDVLDRLWDEVKERGGESPA
jgi:nucleoside triphosphate diphosphatase